MLEDVLITQELSQRAATRLDGSSRLPNWQAEAQAMQTLVRQMASGSDTLLQTLVEKAAELCQAGTAGVSLLETTPDGEELFRWTVLAGTLAQYVGGTTPRNFSPCGVCLDCLGDDGSDRNTLQLFSYPERHFTYLQKANTPIVEGLVLPLIAESHVLGTIWIMSHDQQRHFDLEDVRLMTNLADFTATALLLKQRQTQELLAANAALEAEIAERKQTEEKLYAVQRRLESSLRGANLGVWTYNVSTNEFWADDRAKQMHGHTAHEAQTFAEAGANIHPEDHDRTQAAIAQAIQNGSNLQLEYRVIWGDGSLHGIASYAELIATGEPDGGMFYGVVQDISDRKHHEANLAFLAEGSGIGLSLVQELVKLHGGTIEISSVEGEGSCFRVSIPTGFAHLPPEQIDSPRTGKFSQDASGQSEENLQSLPLPSTARASAYVEEALGWLPQKGKRDTGTENKGFFSHSPLPLRLSPSPASARVLLVDDNADMRAYLKRLLEERWQVETAANGAIALTQIRQYPPDLVLADVMMPEMDGLQLLQALRADPQTNSIPIILLSARTGEEATLEVLTAGANDYLIKPFSARELMARVENHLQLALLRQERSANRFKTEFLLTITHELQAPLATILGWARLLQTRSFNPDTVAQALAAIERNATIEAKLIKDLLDVSGLLSGKVQLKSQLVDLILLIQSVVAAFREAAEQKRIQLIETMLNVPQRNVVADGDRLKQIISNLLENAIKFTPEGGQVHIQVEQVAGNGSVVTGKELDQQPSTHYPLPTTMYVQITITDTGIGIHPDFLPYVFDRFTQAEVPSRHSPGGVGIGLAIARLLVELYGGSIEVASEGKGRGATFTVRLPLRMDNS